MSTQEPPLRTACRWATVPCLRINRLPIGPSSFVSFLSFEWMRTRLTDYNPYRIHAYRTFRRRLTKKQRRSARIRMV